MHVLVLLNLKTCDYGVERKQLDSLGHGRRYYYQILMYMAIQKITIIFKIESMMDYDDCYELSFDQSGALA